MLSMKTTWTLSLETEKLNLLLRALRGVLRAEEISEAQSLATEIAEERVIIVKNSMNEISKLEDNLKKAKSSE